MKKTIFAILFFAFFSVNYCQSSEIDIAPYNSIEDLIQFETFSISNAALDDPEVLSEAYASRAESYLICHRLEEAVNDFQTAYGFALKIQNEEFCSAQTFRSLLGLAIACGHLNQEERIYEIIPVLEKMIHSFQCSNCQEARLSFHDSRINSRFSSFLLQNEDVPIHGPDKISVRDCIDFINNTVKYTRCIIEEVPLAAARAALNYLIDQLADSAKGCCRKGGVWKGCVQKLVNKYHFWNQRWINFGVLPDPKWE